MPWQAMLSHQLDPIPVVKPRVDSTLLPTELIATINCKQSAVRAVRFNGEQARCPPARMPTCSRRQLLYYVW